MRIINKDIFEAYKEIESDSVQCIITSPPYYQARDYGHPDQIGLEKTPDEYLERLIKVFELLKPKLKDNGNLFINLGDKYDKNKSLMLIPEKFSIEMVNQGWILRNKIIWFKPNFQPSPVKDRLTNAYEVIFHFVQNQKYIYNLNSIRIPKDVDKNEEERAYDRFKERVINSELTLTEKENALQELDVLFEEGKINNDARIKIRGQSKVLFGSNTNLSGRAKELQEKGYYFHCNNPLGKNPGDVFFVNVKSHKGIHEAVFPEELVEPLIKVGSSEGDVVLDCFAGTGTTLKVAKSLGRIGLGIELNETYIK